MELLDIYDGDGNPTGRIQPRDTPLAGEDSVLVVDVWIVGSDGRFLLSKRAQEVKTEPGVWQMTCGCVASGEDSYTGALRELEEELGIRPSTQGELYGRFQIPHLLIDVWLFREDIDIGDVTLQPGETCDAMWVDGNQVRELLATGCFIHPRRLPYIETFLGELGIGAVLSHWNLPQNLSAAKIHDNAWDIGGAYILKRCGDIPSLEQSAALSGLLRAQGLPVTEFIPVAEGLHHALMDGEPYCLMRKITGAAPDPFDGDLTQNGLALGAVVADLHRGLKAVEAELHPRENDLSAELRDYIAPALEAQSDYLDAGVLAECRELAEKSAALPRQLIHRDIHTGNLLFDSGHFSGYLDFDLSQRNIRIFDICYLGSSMLVECYRDEAQLSRWVQLFAAIVEGYSQILPLSPEEREAFPSLFVYISALFAAFFWKADMPEAARNCAETANWLHKNLAALLRDIRR